MFTPLSLLCVFNIFNAVRALCGSSVRWSHDFDIDDVYGMWYGVGYAQHTEDPTDKPSEVGCVTLYISDVSAEVGNWLDWTLPRRNYTDERWRSYKNNPFSDTALSGSWLDINLARLRRRRRKREYEERRIQVVWDEDGHTMEQTYVYSIEEPGLWTAEQYRPMEREMRSQGIEMWYPDNPPRHPDVIRMLKVTSDILMINHCSDRGGGGVFSLVLHRSPGYLDRTNWYDIQRMFYKFDLPPVFRHATVCGACVKVVSILCLLTSFAIARVLL